MSSRVRRHQTGGSNRRSLGASAGASLSLSASSGTNSGASTARSISLNSTGSSQPNSLPDTSRLQFTTSIAVPPLHVPRVAEIIVGKVSLPRLSFDTVDSAVSAAVSARASARVNKVPTGKVGDGPATTRETRRAAHAAAIEADRLFDLQHQQQQAKQYGGGPVPVRTPRPPRDPATMAVAGRHSTKLTGTLNEYGLRTMFSQPQQAEYWQLMQQLYGRPHPHGPAANNTNTTPEAVSDAAFGRATGRHNKNAETVDSDEVKQPEPQVTTAVIAPTITTAAAPAFSVPTPPSVSAYSSMQHQRISNRMRTMLGDEKFNTVYGHTSKPRGKHRSAARGDGNRDSIGNGLNLSDAVDNSSVDGSATDRSVMSTTSSRSGVSGGVLSDCERNRVRAVSDHSPLTVDAASAPQMAIDERSRFSGRQHRDSAATRTVDPHAEARHARILRNQQRIDRVSRPDDLAVEAKHLAKWKAQAALKEGWLRSVREFDYQSRAFRFGTDQYSIATDARVQADIAERLKYRLVPPFHTNTPPPVPSASSEPLV